MNESILPHAPQASVRVQVDPEQGPGWLGVAEAVTLDLMADGTVRWRQLERAGMGAAEEPALSAGLAYFGHDHHARTLDPSAMGRRDHGRLEAG